MNTQHPLMTNIMSLADGATWRRSIQAGDRALSKWRDGLARRRLAHVYFLGCGTSLYAGQVAKYAVEHIAHIPAEAVQAFAFATYAEPAILNSQTLVVGISTTGNTEAVCDALARAHEAGAPTLGITARPESKIAQVADYVIPTGVDVTLSVKTRTYVCSLITLYLLALYLAETGDEGSGDVMAHWRQQIELAADGTRQFLECQQTEIKLLAERYAKAPMVFVFGTGPNAGTAEEASLKVAEMAKVFSEAQELENFLHGRFREVGENTPAFFIAPHSRASERVLDFLAVMEHVGAPSIVLTDQITTGIQRLATHVVRMPGGLEEFATPLLYIVPLYLLGYHMALERGYDPAARRYPDIVPQNVRYRERFDV
jgi:glucosamine 6-phosphate synthetase-like amidotransferase/phosphosugar isomerase protein